MISPFEFPMGDLQTWVNYKMNWSKSDELIMNQVLSEDLSLLLLKNNIRPIGIENNVLILRDTVSGLPFLHINGIFRLDKRKMVSPEYDLIDACFYRAYLSGNYPGKDGMILTNLFTGSALDRFGLDSLNFLSNPIAEYEVTSKSELYELVKNIEGKLSKGPYFKGIWLRGQRQEYLINRDAKVCDLLGFGAAGTVQPSILPSLGRYVLQNPGIVDESFILGGPSHYWKKPFIVWIIKNNPQWLKHYPEFVARIEEALKSENDMDFSKILYDIQYDSLVPDEVDDLRQWFFAHFKYSSWVMVLQQYGYMTSMLDLTWDIETALFFTHTRMNNNTFEFVTPTKERVIYVFAESKESSSFRHSNQIDWGDSDWNRDTPSRVLSQKCGAVVGSTKYRQYQYSHLVVARIRILDNGIVTNRTIDEVFPTKEQDLLYKTLFDSVPKPEGLY